MWLLPSYGRFLLFYNLFACLKIVEKSFLYCKRWQLHGVHLWWVTPSSTSNVTANAEWRRAFPKKSQFWGRLYMYDSLLNIESLR